MKFTELIKILKQLKGGQLKTVKFNPKSLNDDIALKAQWLYMSNTFSLSRLKKVSSVEYETKSSSLPFAAAVVLIFSGFFGIISKVQKVNDFSYSYSHFYKEFIICIILIIISLFLFRITLKKVRFFINKETIIDKNKKMYPFKKVYATQILRDYRTGNKTNSGGYYEYELNLIMVSGERIHIIRTKDLEEINDCLKIFSMFFRIKQWSTF